MSTRTILAVNPSHATPLEREFWGHVASEADRAGWHLVELSARSIDPTPGASMIVIPARLHEFANRMGRLPAEQLARDPDWLSCEEAAIQADWEHRRWPLGTFTPASCDGTRRLAWFIESAMDALEPAVVLTTNKIDHPCFFARRAAEARGVATAVIERSPFDSIWYEHNGLFTESGIWSALDGVVPSAAAESGDLMLSRVRSNPAGFRVAEASDDRPQLGGLTRPLVFLAFDNLLWTGWGQASNPQRSVDNPLFERPSEGISAVADWAASHGGSVALKAHPSCVVTPTIPLPPNVDLVDGPLDHLVGEADLTVCFNSKVAFVAAALGARVVTLANNPIAAAPVVTHWADHATVVDALDAGLVMEPPPEAIVGSFFGWLAENHFYEPTPHPWLPGPRQLVERIVADATSTGADPDPHVSSGVDDLARLARGEVGADPTSAPGTIRGSRQRVVLDVSRLLDPSLRASGIARYADELLKGLAASGAFELWAAVRPPASRDPAVIDDYLRLQEITHGRVANLDERDRSRVLERLGGWRDDDVFHSTHPPLPPRELTGCARRIITIHDVLHITRPELYEGPRPAAIERILASVDKQQDLVICVSEQTRRDLLSLHPLIQPIPEVVHSGIRMSEVDPVLPPQVAAAFPHGFVLALAQDDVRKNVDGIVKGTAAALCRRGNEDLGFVIMTSDARGRGAREALAASDLANHRVAWVSQPDDSEMAGLMASARAFVFAPLYEGFGFPPLEAMSVGCPVVVGANSSLPEVVRDAAVYALGAGAQAIEEAVQLVLVNGGLADELRRRGPVVTRALTWERTVARMVAVYESAARVGRAA